MQRKGKGGGLRGRNPRGPPCGGPPCKPKGGGGRPKYM